MADSYVCSGAMMRCTMGSSPAKLTVLPSRTVYLAGKPQANISDTKSMVNLGAFGLCRSMGYPATASATAAAHGVLTPMPCMHNTPMPWIGGKTDHIVKGQPALLKSCKCQCMWGGTISLLDNGQVGEGARGVTAKKKQSIRQGQKQNQIQLDEILNAPHSLSKITLINKLKKYSDEQKQWIAKKAASYKAAGLSTMDSVIKAEHDLAFINSRKSTSMDDNQADLKHSNPKYGLSKQYGINCATTTTAFMLRKQGYDVVARAKNANAHTAAIARELNLYDVWKNPDGSDVSPTMLLDAFNAKVAEKGLTKEFAEFERTKDDLLKIRSVINNPGNIDPQIIEKLTIREKELMKTYNSTRVAFEPVYKEMLLEACQEEGYYTFGLVWDSVKYGGGHYTVIKSVKDKNGNTVLTNIEPQTGVPYRSIDALITNLDFPPDEYDTVMRTDDKVFNEEYNDLFDIN